MILLVGLLSAVALGTALMLPDVMGSDGSDEADAQSDADALGNEAEANATDPDNLSTTSNPVNLLDYPTADTVPADSAVENGSDTEVPGADLFGTDVQDTLVGTSASEALFGGDDDDELGGYDGDDTIYGGDGTDDVHGMSSDDLLFGDAGSDSLHGGLGEDAAYGGADTDLVSGYSGDDVLHGDAGDDDLIGGAGDDAIFGGSGDDGLMGADGDDRLVLGDGADTAFGGDGNDEILGSNDGAPDFLNGNSGDDTLHLYNGDYGHGGDGGDIFILHGAGEPAPQILDFNPDTDEIVVRSDTTDGTLFFAADPDTPSTGELWLNDEIVARLDNTPTLDLSRVQIVPTQT